MTIPHAMYSFSVISGSSSMCLGLTFRASYGMRKSRSAATTACGCRRLRIAGTKHVARNARLRVVLNIIATSWRKAMRESDVGVGGRNACNTSHLGIRLL